MATCPNCGEKQWLLAKKKCLVCGKVHCTKCALPLFQLQVIEGMEYNRYTPPVSVCSEKCWKVFLEEIKAIIDKTPHLSQEDPEMDSILFLKVAIHPAILHYLQEKQRKHELQNCWNEYLPRMRRGTSGEVGVRAGYSWDFVNSDRILQEFQKRLCLIKATIREEKERKEREERERQREIEEKEWREHGLPERVSELLEKAKLAERAGRYEDAAGCYEMIASMYEGIGLYDKAREQRGIARQLKGKDRRVVVVDLNKLLQQVRDGGIVAVYRCPNCGGKLKVSKETRLESLKSCEHCGSKIEAMDLADFLRTALSWN